MSVRLSREQMTLAEMARTATAHFRDWHTAVLVTLCSQTTVQAPPIY